MDIYTKSLWSMTIISLIGGIVIGCILMDNYHRNVMQCKTPSEIEYIYKGDNKHE